MWTNGGLHGINHCAFGKVLWRKGSETETASTLNVTSPCVNLSATVNFYTIRFNTITLRTSREHPSS